MMSTVATVELANCPRTEAPIEEFWASARAPGCVCPYGLPTFPNYTFPCIRLLLIADLHSHRVWAASPPPTMSYVCAPSPTWYTTVPSLPHKPDLPSPSPSQLSSITERASSLLSSDASKYSSSSASQNASDAHFLKTILSTGTLSDRLSALTLLVQASPVHSTAALDSLRTMAQRGRAKGGRDEGLKAVRCVVDWWVGGGGPGRKLKSVFFVCFILLLTLTITIHQDTSAISHYSIRKSQMHTFSSGTSRTGSRNTSSLSSRS